MNEVKSVKYLGILIDSQLTYKDHIDEKVKKNYTAIGVLYKTRPFITTKTLTNIYYAIVPFLLDGLTAGEMLVNHFLHLYTLCKKKDCAYDNIQ